MSFVSCASIVANTSASLVGFVTIGLVTMKYIFRNYPKFPSSKIAAYPVASLKGCRIKSKDKTDCTVQFQIFYPCVDNCNGEEGKQSTTQGPNYMRPSALEGLYRSMGNSKILKYFLQNILLEKPAAHLKDGLDENISPLMCSKINDTAANKNVKSWPVVIFSHGLFGSLELYSTICCEMASHGFVVVALEHEDGSASFAEKMSFNSSESSKATVSSGDLKVFVNDGREKVGQEENKEEYFDKCVIAYKRPVGVTYSEKSSVVNFRKPFLCKRYEEICDVIDSLVELASSPSNEQNSDGADVSDPSLIAKNCLKEVLMTTTLSQDQDKSLILAGHSFGGATMQYMMYRLANETTKKIVSDIKIQSLVLLDTWVSPVPDEVLSQSFPRIPTLSIFCETFVTWTPTKESHELEGVEKMLEANKRSTNDMFQCVAIRGTRHQFFSDAPYWMPKTIGKYAKVSGETDISISRSCLEKLIVKFLLKSDAPPISELTEEERSYVYNVDKSMLNAPVM